jgi:hypothetical protein
MKTPETWRPIPGFPGYEASDHGQIRSTERTLPDGRRSGGQILKQGTSNRGRPKCNLRRDGQPVTINVPRMILLTFAGPPPEGKPYTRHHPDDNPWNNNIGNLSWCDWVTNEQDKWERARRLGYVEPVNPPARRVVVDAQSLRSCPKPRHGVWSRIVAMIKRNRRQSRTVTTSGSWEGEGSRPGG